MSISPPRPTGSLGLIRQTMERASNKLKARARFIRDARRNGSGLLMTLHGHKPVNMGDLRRLRPIDRNFGYSRGLPVDRFYIERFLQAHADDIRGRVLEIKDDGYTRRFGGARVSHSDVLDINPRNRQATIIGDLAASDTLTDSTYDCIILTQTLHHVFDVDAALANLYRALKPGGVLLLTVPSITRIDDSAPWYWFFTQHSMARLLGAWFPSTDIRIEAHGNVLVATAFLQGIAAEELSPEELEFKDWQYVINITARASRPADPV